MDAKIVLEIVDGLPISGRIVDGQANAQDMAVSLASENSNASEGVIRKAIEMNGYYIEGNYTVAVVNPTV